MEYYEDYATLGRNTTQWDRRSWWEWMRDFERATNAERQAVYVPAVVVDEGLPDIPFECEV